VININYKHLYYIYYYVNNIRSNKGRKKLKTFSIITPVLNNKARLIRTIESVKKQKFSDYEIIVIDGGSTDGTKEYLESEKKISKFITENDKGIYDAINKGIRISEGKYINSINAGDEYYSDESLQIIKNYFDKKEEISFIFGAVKKNKIFYKYEPKKMSWSFNFYPSHSGGFFVKKEVHDEIGLYNLKYKCSSDYDFFWRMIKTHKYKGISTEKKDLISIFEPGGFSSKYGVYNHIWEETRIRLNNKQNFFIVFGIYFLRVIRNFYKFNYKFF